MNEDAILHYLRESRATINAAIRALRDPRSRFRELPDEEPPETEVERDPPPATGDDQEVERPPVTDTVTAAPAVRRDPVRPSRPHAVVEGGGRLSLADVYKSIRQEQSGDQGVVLGIKGNVGGFGIGSENGLWGTNEHPIDLQLVGLDDQAMVGPFGPAFGGSDVPVRRFALFSAGIMANPDSFVVRQGGPLLDAELVFEDFWMVPYQPGFVHTSGLHLQDGWRTLTIKGYRPQGPGQNEPTRFREHCFYLKGGGLLQVLDSNLMGGNRCGVHYRPHGSGFISYPFGATPPPTGPIILDGNWAEGQGWDHENPSGGAWLTVWTSLEQPVVFRNNRLERGRYGGLLVSRQPANVNPYLTRDGRGHSLIWIEGNEIHVDGDRSAVKVSDTREAFFAGHNLFRSENRTDLVIDDEWSASHGAPLSGSVSLSPGATVDAETVMTWDRRTQQLVPLTLPGAPVR
jgi:hypothetical protein